MEDDETLSQIYLQYRKAVQKLFSQELAIKYNDPENWLFIRKGKKFNLLIDITPNDGHPTVGEDIFQIELIRNDRLRTLTVEVVGFGFNPLYSTYVKNSKAYKNYQKDLLRKIKNGDEISRFQNLGLFSIFMNYIEKTVKQYASDQKKKWTIVVSDIRSKLLHDLLKQNRDYEEGKTNSLYKNINP